MSTRTVRLDEEAEANLQDLQDLTGLSISEILKRGLASLHKEAVEEAPALTPYEVWKSLDFGEGDPSIPPAKDAKKAVREIIRKKHGYPAE